MSWLGIGIVTVKRGKIKLPSLPKGFSEYKLSVGTDGAILLLPHKISDRDKFKWKRLQPRRNKWKTRR